MDVTVSSPRRSYRPAMLVVLAHGWLETDLRDDDAVGTTLALGRYLIAAGRYSCVGCQLCHKYP
jgi:hypothetical protein